MRVELYGVLAEAAGTAQTELEIGDGQTVQSVLDALQTRLPALSDHLPRVACAVGDELVMRGDTLDPEATLVLLPPVSGG
jgi:molybdopterin converting factor small subunit